VNDTPIDKDGVMEDVGLPTGAPPGPDKPGWFRTIRAVWGSRAGGVAPTQKLNLSVERHAGEQEKHSEVEESWQKPAAAEQGSSEHSS
jgi:hypothetical protein